MKIYLATWFEDFYGRDLTAVGVTNRLTSYFGVRRNRLTKRLMRQYVRHGIFKRKK